MVAINTDELTGYGDAECLGIAAAAFDLQARCDAVLRSRRAARAVELKAQHQRLIVERRKHGEVLAALRVQGGELQADSRELARAESKCSFDLRVLRGQKPNPEFALAAEIEGHDREVAALEQELEKIHRRQFDHNAVAGTWTREAEEGNAKLEKLNREVQSLWDDIQTLETGQRPKRHDAQTGLWNVAVTG